MSQVFPYGITLKEGGRVEVFPAAEVQFSTANGDWLSIYLIIDSGATISALPKSDAEVFGIDPEKGEAMVIAGISGTPIHGWRHQLSVRIGKRDMKIPFVFIDAELTPRVLGREGLFDRVLVVFEEQARRTGFITRTSKEGKAIRILLDQME